MQIRLGNYDTFTFQWYSFLLQHRFLIDVQLGPSKSLLTKNSYKRTPNLFKHSVYSIQ